MKGGRLLGRVLKPGLLDAGTASLATFLIGLYATRHFPPELLGAYALSFTAFVLSSIVPAQLLFTPAELQALPAKGARRLRLLDQSLRLALLPAAVPAVLFQAVALFGPGHRDPHELLPLALTATITSIVSPVQDHVRRLHHMAGRSWNAAAMSGLQLTAAVAVLALLHFSHTTPTLIPFGTLAAANSFSLVLGLGLSLERLKRRPLDRLDVGQLYRTGGWVLLGGLAPQGAVFLSALLIARLAGAATVGFVEATRLIGAPLQVLATGLSATAAPRLLEAGRTGAEADGRHETRRYSLGMLVIGAPYLALVGWAWPLNPLARIVPLAYEIDHLAALSVVAAVVFALTAPPRYELLGGNRARTLTFLESSASAVQCVVSLGAAVIGAFAGPTGVIAQSLARWLVLWPARRRMYAHPDEEPLEPERLPYQRFIGDGWVVQYSPEAVERHGGRLDLDEEGGIVRTVDWADAGELPRREPRGGDPPRVSRN